MSSLGLAWQLLIGSRGALWLPHAVSSLNAGLLGYYGILDDLTMGRVVGRIISELQTCFELNRRNDGHSAYEAKI